MKTTIKDVRIKSNLIEIDVELTEGTLRLGDIVEYLYKGNLKYTFKIFEISLNNGTTKNIVSIGVNDQSIKLTLVIKNEKELVLNDLLFQNKTKKFKPFAGFKNFGVYKDDRKFIKEKLPEHGFFTKKPKFIIDKAFFKHITLRHKLKVEKEQLNFIESINNKKELGLCLQGGGLKGAFSVGALKCLEDLKILTTDKKLKITSASTGSITAAVIAENKINSVDNAIKQYTDLRISEDMFTFRPRVKRIINSDNFIKDLVRKIFQSKLDFNFDLLQDLGKSALDSVITDAKKGFYDEQGIKEGNALFLGFGPAGLLVSIIKESIEVIFDAIDRVEQLLSNTMKVLNTETSLAKIDRVEQKIIDQIEDPRLLDKRITTNRSSLKMAVTSLSTGATCYLTEKKDTRGIWKFVIMYPKKREIDTGDSYNYSSFENYEVISIKNKDNSSDWENTYAGGKNRVKFYAAAAVTSGAFPGFFEPKIIHFKKDGKSRREFFNDGGIKENTPLKLLMNSNSPNNIVIHNKSFYYTPKDLDRLKKTGWTDILKDSLDLINHENERENISYGDSVNNNLESKSYKDFRNLHIAPNLPTISLTNIDPMGIKNTIWYGYLRAFDEIFINKNLNKEDYDDVVNYYNDVKSLRDNSDNIFATFKILFDFSYQMIEHSIYRARIKAEDSSKYKYYTYNKDRKYGRGNDTTGYDFEFESLKNETNDIKHRAININVLAKYFQLKIKILGFIEARINLIKQLCKNEDSSHDIKSCVMQGEYGFMKLGYYTDWFGVYEKLDQMNLASNKRVRLIKSFIKHNIFKDENPSVYKIENNAHLYNPLIYKTLDDGLPKNNDTNNYDEFNFSLQYHRRPKNLSDHQKEDRDEIYQLLKILNNKLVEINKEGLKFEGSTNLISNNFILIEDDHHYRNDGILQ